MHSQQKLQSSSIGEIGGSNVNPATGHMAGQNMTSHTNSQHIGGHSSGPAHEGASRILSAETINERAQRKSITDVL